MAIIDGNKKKLTVSGEAIESAVNSKHEHSNSSVLDKLSDNNGTLQYNGADITGGSASEITASKVKMADNTTVEDTVSSLKEDLNNQNNDLYEIETSTNLIDKDNLIVNDVALYTWGSNYTTDLSSCAYASTNHITTDIISVKSGDIYKFVKTDSTVLNIKVVQMFWDKNGNFISFVNDTNITVPDNATQMRLTFNNLENTPAGIMKVNSINDTPIYKPYGLNSKNKKFATVEEIKDFMSNKVKNELIGDINGISVMGANTTITDIEDGKEIIVPSTANEGVYIAKINKILPKNALIIDYNVNIKSGSLYLMFGGTSKSGSAKFGQYMKLENGENTIELASDYLEVYQDLDTSKNWYICFGNNSTASDFEILKLNVYIKESDLDFKKTLTENLEETKNKLVNVESQVNAINPVSLVNQNGEKFFLQMLGNELKYVNSIPDNILFIGNSLLLGFKTYGMAASDNKHDYAYLLTQYITDKLGSEPTINKLHGGVIESLSTPNSDEWWYSQLESLCTEDVKFVLVQLGDNVNDDIKLANWNPLKLCKYLRTNCPNARVVWAGLWLMRPKALDMIISACNQTGVQYIAINDLVYPSNCSETGAITTYPEDTTTTYTITSFTDDSDNKKLTLNYTINDKDYTTEIAYTSYTDNEDNTITVVGKEVIITNSGVAGHPGDSGMKAIAERIIEKAF